MDSTTIKKYFNLGDEVAITTLHAVSIGKIVDFSDSVIVIEDVLGSPIIIDIKSIISCKITTESIAGSVNDLIEKSPSDDISNIISDIIAAFDSIYEQNSIVNDEIIPTNATVTGLSPKGVEVQTDDGSIITCVKSSFVGYSRENAAIGKRVFCHPNKNNISYASLTEMTYGEVYERFLRAINTKPKPRTPILGSVLLLLTKQFGNAILSQKKTIKQLIKKMSDKDDSSPTEQPHALGLRKISLDKMTIDQKKQIYELLHQYKSEFAGLPQVDQIRYADALITEHLELRVKRKSVIIIVNDILRYDNLPSSLFDQVNTDAGKSSSQSLKEDEDPFFSATCEINKYYPKYKNGTASNTAVEEIRFKDDVIIDDDLKMELKSFQFWDKDVAPIPVISVYKKTGKWHTASFITRPGKLSDLLSKINKLRSDNKHVLADSVQNYLESKGYIDNSKSQIDISLSSEELLSISKRQRLIKNFDDAEKGFLELIRRRYSLDVAVRDLAMMYQEWKKIPLAIDLLKQNLPDLEDKMKAYNMLFTFYHTTNHDAEAIRIMEIALELYPGDDKSSIKRRNKIERKIDYIKKKKRKAHFSSEDIPAALLRYDANNTTGEVLAYITDKSYDEKLNFLNQRIGELKNSPELPSYYLAKIQLLEDNGESSRSLQVKNLLADYCRAKARNFFYDENQISAREYLLQGISVIEREDLYYLLYLSLCTSPQEVLSKYNNTLWSYDEISSKYALKEDDDTFYVLFRIFKENTTLSRKLLRVLYESDACSWICDELDVDSINPSGFVDLITNTANDYSNSLLSFEKTIDELLLSNSAPTMSRSLLNMEMLNLKKYSSFDVANFVVVSEIANNILDFEKNIGYEDCEEICRNAFTKVDTTISLIQKCPTRISTLCLLPILLKLRDLMERALNKKYADTLPQIIIEPTDDARPINDEIEIQVSISNEMGSSRVNNGIFKIESINGKDVSTLSLLRILDHPLIGGNKYKVAFTLKSTLFTSDSIEIGYSFSYLDVRKESRSKHDKITLAINKGSDYEDFDNPFIAHVKSNAVKDKSMFKGRDEIIDTICKYVLEDYKGYVLYGQKRSGKSSVLYHITQRLRAERKAFAVEYTMGSGIVKETESENESLANLFYTIISEIGRAIKEVDRNVYKECGCHIIKRKEFEDYPDQTFREYLDFYREIIVDKLHYEQDKIVLIVDEFTYLYYHILDKKISPGIMEFWKGLVESRVFSFVFAGQDAMPRFMDAFENVFESMAPQELTYIDEKSARELIEEPIWNKKMNCSRFKPEAVDEIIKLTACSPFYIMILCSELVKYARNRKKLPISDDDVNILLQRMICNESSIGRKDFDNLISCGESRFDIIDKDDSLKVLKDIAMKARNVTYYDINAINVFDKDKVKNIIKDLLRRGVLEPHPLFSNKVKIKVELFKRWLLNHE